MQWLFILLNIFFVQFTDKEGTTGDIAHPEEYLSERALERRKRYNISIDSLDLPVSQTYLQALQEQGAQVLHTSRWLNGASIETTDENAQAIAQWTFVKNVERTQNTNTINAVNAVNKFAFERQETSPHRMPALAYDEDEQDLDLYGSAYWQEEQIDILPLHKLGFKGRGMLIAMIDDGFYNVDNLEAFNSIRENIVGYYDLTGENTIPYSRTDDSNGGFHGTQCLSVIGAIRSGFYGIAPHANFALFRTETNASESIKEADNQLVAFEMADSLGADIISSSLGYGTQMDDPEMEITYQELNGRTWRNSLGANIAARKGIIVCISAGNEGRKPWKYITTPADADSIFAVGAVDASGERATFSSYGPTNDGRIKPDIATWGQNTAVINPETGDITHNNGTSFSCPLMAGAVACLWSALPNLNNMQIIEKIIQNASHYNNPDNEIGYGIPNFYEAYKNSTTELQNIVNQQDNETFFYDVLGRKRVTPLKNGVSIQKNKKIMIIH